MRFWQKTRQSLERRQEYPFAEFAARGMKAREVSILLDPPILAGLHEISAITGKTSSRIISEILLDTMNAQAELAAASPLLDGFPREARIGKPERREARRKTA